MRFEKKKSYSVGKKKNIYLAYIKKCRKLFLGNTIKKEKKILEGFDCLIYRTKKISDFIKNNPNLIINWTFFQFHLQLSLIKYNKKMKKKIC